MREWGGMKIVSEPAVATCANHFSLRHDRVRDFFTPKFFPDLTRLLPPNLGENATRQKKKTLLAATSDCISEGK